MISATARDLRELEDVRIDATDTESLMLIEANTGRDVFISLTLALLVIAATTCAGVYGPPLLEDSSSRFALTPDRPNSIISLAIPGVSPQNLFLMIKLAFELPAPPSEARSCPISFSYFLIFYRQNRQVRREERSITQNVSFVVSRDRSDDILFFFDRFLSYDRVDLRIDFAQTSSVSDAVVYWARGETAHLKFQAWIRMAFGLASVATLVVFWVKLRRQPRPKWTLEQKLTLALNIGSVVGVNPLFVVYVLRPTILQEILNAFLSRFFASAVFMFMLLVIDHVRLDRISECFFAPKLAFLAVQLMVEMAYPVLYNGWDIPGVEAVAPPFVVWVNCLKIALYVVFVVWFLARVAVAFRRTDSTERFKLCVYAGAFALVSAVNLSDSALAKLAPFRNSSALFTLHFASLHSLVLIMIFAHWPAEFELEELAEDANGAPGASNVHDLMESSDGQH
jgi:hypothetical protein